MSCKTALEDGSYIIHYNQQRNLCWNWLCNVLFFSWKYNPIYPDAIDLPHNTFTNSSAACLICHTGKKKLNCSILRWLLFTGSKPFFITSTASLLNWSHSSWEWRSTRPSYSKCWRCATELEVTRRTKRCARAVLACLCQQMSWGECFICKGCCWANSKSTSIYPVGRREVKKLLKE